MLLLFYADIIPEMNTMKINRMIANKNNGAAKKSAVDELEYDVYTDIEKKKDSFKSNSHIAGHTMRSMSKEFDMKGFGSMILKGEAKFKGKIKADMDVSPDRFLANPAIRLKQQNVAGIEVGKNIDLPHIRINGTAEAGLQANVDCGAEGIVHISSRECEFGFKLADRIEFGTYEGVKLAASTERGSKFNLNVRLEQGPQFGGAIGAGIKIDREAIHGKLELDGNFGLFGTDIKASFTLRYDDVKHAVDKVVNAVIAGPLGMIASRIFHRAEQDDKLQGKYTPQKEDNKEHDVNRVSDVKKTEDKDSIKDDLFHNVSRQHFKRQNLKFDG